MAALEVEACLLFPRKPSRRRSMIRGGRVHSDVSISDRNSAVSNLYTAAILSEAILRSAHLYQVAPRTHQLNSIKQTTISLELTSKEQIIYGA